VPNTVIGEIFNGRHKIEMHNNQTYVDSNPISDFVLGELRSGKTELIFDDKKVKHLFDLELKHWNALSSNRSKSPSHKS